MNKLNYRVLFIEDNPNTISYILDMMEDLDFIAKSPVVLSSPEEGFNYLRQEEVDILFLDMDFGREDINGLKLFGMLSNPPVTVACTAYTSYAFDRHEVGIDEYISKLIGFKAFERVMRKVVAMVDAKEERERREIDKLLLLDVMGTEVELLVKDIYFARVDDKIVTVMTEYDSHSFKMSLIKFKNLLPIEDFSKPHGSYLVSLSKVSGVNRKQVYFKEPSIREIITISQEFNASFKHALKLFQQRKKTTK